jgi:tetratricopeptide (TPR) repeat protein
MSTVFPLESGRHCGYRLLLLLLMLLVVASLPTGARAQTSQQPGAAAAELTEQQIEQLVLTGQVQHEIVKELIKQGRFDLVLPEMRKIFALNLPDAEEDKIAESASIIAKLLVDKRQMSLAHNVLDEAFARMNRNADRANILKIKAYVYKEEGKLDMALKTMQQALALEKIPDKTIK